MKSRPLLILKTGATFRSLAVREGDFEDWIRSGLGLPEQSVRIVDLESREDLPKSSEISGIVITGSHAMVTDSDPRFARAAAWIERQVTARTPLLGICFGHQMLAHALGGEVGWTPGGREIGSRRITTEAAARRDPLLAELPQAFPAQCSHAQSVLSLPSGAVRLARSAYDPNQVVQFGERAWGVQFHPEFSESIMRSYIEWHRRDLIDQGDDPDRLAAAVEASPAVRLLRHFREQC